MLITLHTAAALDLRRRCLLSAPLGCVLPTAANAAEQVMRTSSDIGSYADATGSQRAANLGAGSISGKSRPYTGVVLAEGRRAEGVGEDELAEELAEDANEFLILVYGHDVFSA